MRRTTPQNDPRPASVVAENGFWLSGTDNPAGLCDAVSHGSMPTGRITIMHGTANDEADPWRKLDWNDVRTFLAVAESGSLNAAARVLGMTQPTISRRMEDLEYRLSARLFDRSSRGVTLTDAG